MSVTDFANLPLSSEQLATLKTLQYNQMTPVQAQSLPAMLAGDDVIAQAQTGSGKTAAFALGLLARLNPADFHVQSLVLCPTRELAEQVADEIRRLARSQANIKVLTLCGGVPSRIQTQSLQHGAHVIVGTPGRILDHLTQQRVHFSRLQTLVLDEADRMLDMGFQAELDQIIAATPATRQTLLFSATFPSQIASLTERLMRSPKHVVVEENPIENSIEQVFYEVSSDSREDAVIQLLLERQPDNAILFCNTKRETHALFTVLHNVGFSVQALHGDLEQRDREQTLLQFNNKSVRILVATDVAARGLDIKALDMVINVSMAHDTDTHIHRVGRTGRAGEVGLAITLVTPADEYKFRLLQDTMPTLGQPQQLPESAAQQVRPLHAEMTTIHIMGGKKDKLRPGDIVGALTRNNVLDFDSVGKISIQSINSYVAIKKDKAKLALSCLNNDKLKGRRFKARLL
ncbi:ATP-dependent RNA helicase DbpA [Aliidiomarina halalkaliphila]|uniref:ATP-dependent RNA helicase DbpA n=1 Tax=Aliidiomarina halalkaliphila TaxID=2593535 RepID=A0A552X1G6_9GAMM|nr:ATP-dependent RNA helicase DbpA [Aliidiomarina halalkaliphila]TRW48890.1 ATP-dependent RNA helicase DbpA [Aliidiomarina halalkaliphila]